MYIIGIFNVRGTGGLNSRGKGLGRFVRSVWASMKLGSFWAGLVWSISGLRLSLRGWKYDVPE